jgi:hypothetical protein
MSRPKEQNDKRQAGRLQQASRTLQYRLTPYSPKGAGKGLQESPCQSDVSCTQEISLIRTTSPQDYPRVTGSRRCCKCGINLGAFNSPSWAGVASKLAPILLYRAGRVCSSTFSKIEARLISTIERVVLGLALDISSLASKEKAAFRGGVFIRLLAHHAFWEMSILIQGKLRGMEKEKAKTGPENFTKIVHRARPACSLLGNAEQESKVWG